MRLPGPEILPEVPLNFLSFDTRFFMVPDELDQKLKLVRGAEPPGEAPRSGA